MYVYMGMQAGMCTCRILDVCMLFCKYTICPRPWQRQALSLAACEQRLRAANLGKRCLYSDPEDQRNTRILHTMFSEISLFLGL